MSRTLEFLYDDVYVNMETDLCKFLETPKRCPMKNIRGIKSSATTR